MGHAKDLWLKDFWIKAFSLVFAVFLWMSIVGGESAEEFFVVPLKIRNVPENMIISNDIADYVNVRVRGKKGVLNGLMVKEIDVGLNLKDAKEGENTITLFPEEVKLPEGVSTVRVSPSQFMVRLSRLAEKWLPVEPVFLGAPPDGFTRSWTVAPQKAKVMGLEKDLTKQVKVETEPIDSFGKTESFDVEVSLKPLNGNVHVKEPRKVRVRVEITEKIGRREFNNLPVMVAGPAEGVTLRPEHVTLVVKGPESMLDRLLPSSIQIVVPEQSKPGTNNIRPEVHLPKGLEAVGMRPETIRVKVKAPSGDGNR